MGLETARLLVHAGASVTIVGRRQEKLGGLIRHVRDKMKSVKYLVNAAGVFAPKAFLEHADEDYDAYMDGAALFRFRNKRITLKM